MVNHAAQHGHFWKCVDVEDLFAFDPQFLVSYEKQNLIFVSTIVENQSYTQIFRKFIKFSKFHIFAASHLQQLQIASGVKLQK